MLNEKAFRDAIDNLDQAFEVFVLEAIRRSKLYYYKFFQIAKRFGIISKDSSLNFSQLKRIAELYRNSIIEREVFNEILHEKLDLENAKNCIKELKKIHFVKVNKPSKFSELLLKRVFSFTQIPMLEANLLDKIKNRLYNTELIFVCMNCKSYWKRKVKDVDFERCIKCNSPLISIIKFEKDLEFALKVLNKQSKGIKLDKNEEEFYNKLYESSALFQSFGKKAALVLAGKGIGIETAKRILNVKRLYEDENELVKEIYKKEKEFIKIRHFIE